MKPSIIDASAGEWYGENEWNVGLWGTYAFTHADYPSAGNTFLVGEAPPDRYIAADHAWGGGIDVKRFFGRYFGLGFEGYGIGASRMVVDAEGPFGIFSGGTVRTHKDSRVVGSALGVFTLRYPLANSRIAPYLCFGGGAIFAGGERDQFSSTSNGAVGSVFLTTIHTGGRTEGFTTPPPRQRSEAVPGSARAIGETRRCSGRAAASARSGSSARCGPDVAS